MSSRPAVIGNDAFPLDAAIGAQVVDILRSLGDATILTRKRPVFDVFVQHCSTILGIRCLTYDAEGGPSNLTRDATLVRDCTELLCFLAPDSLEDGRKTGTMILMELALNAAKPVRAYTSVDGALVWAGELP